MIIQLAGCLIFNDEGKLLLLHRVKKDKDQWELPGGKVEDNEDIKAAAIRELKEELDIKVQITESLGRGYFDENKRKFEYHWLLAKIDSGNPKVHEPDTFKEFGYFSFKEIISLNLSANMELLISTIQVEKLASSFVRKLTI